MQNKGKKVLILVGVLFLMYRSIGFTEQEDSIYALNIGKVVVTASKIEQENKYSTQNISIIESKDIEANGETDVTKVLDLVPSVDVIEYGSYGSTKTVHIRGASNSQVITLINGRPVNTPRDGVADFNLIPLNNIERIEVMRGPASNIYGSNAIGGVINIITKSGKEKMSTELNLKGGTFATYGADFANGWKIGNADYFLTADYLKSDGFRTNSDYEQQNYDLKLGYDLNKENRVTFDCGYAKSEGGTPGRNGDEDLDDRQEQWKDYFDLTWNGSCWNDSKIFFKLYQNLDRLEFIESLSPIHDKDANQTKVYGLYLQISQIWFDIFRTSIGVDGQDNRLNSSTSAKHRYNFKAAYGEAELDLFEDLAIKGGLRIDDYSNFGNNTSPSASFSWLLFDKIKTHGLIAKAFRAPTFNDLYWPKEDWGIWGGVEGNPNLKPEKATSHEIGIGAFLFDKVEADVTYFYTKFKDMINWNMDDTYWWRPTNIGIVVTKGVEADFNLRLNKIMKLDLNYTRLSAVDTVTDKWIIYRPRHQFKAAISGDLYDKFIFYLSGRYLSKRYTTDTNSRFLKSYFVADANMIYKLFKAAEVNLTINNILDRDYEETDGYPMPGTSFLAGMKLKF